MLKRKFSIIVKYAVLLIILIFGSMTINNICLIEKLPSVINADYTILQNINKEKKFGKFVHVDVHKDVPVSTNTQSYVKIDLYLFKIIKIRTLKVNTEDETIFPGGEIIGLSLNGDGVVIVNVSAVNTALGTRSTFIGEPLKKGDVIKSLNGQSVKSASDIYKITNSEKNGAKEMEVIANRNGKEVKTTMCPEFDINSQMYKLGLWVKDDASGIGTLTYIKNDKKRFGALGHAIGDPDTGMNFNINNGEVYRCAVLGVKKGTKGCAGELKGLFMQDKRNCIGNVDKNCEYGIFGNLHENNFFLNNKEEVKIGGRLYVKPGEAYIRTSVDGDEVKDYKIEIVKTNYQSSSNEKSMVIRVVDKELLRKTGGIVQGMSGSPIIQNGRIVGAVTHVFLNDSTKGFGIYLDWMINE